MISAVQVVTIILVTYPHSGRMPSNTVSTVADSTRDPTADAARTRCAMRLRNATAPTSHKKLQFGFPRRFQEGTKFV